MITGRPVATRASLTEASTASAPRVRQEGLPRTAGQQALEPLVQPQPGLVVDDVLLAVEELRGLGLDRGDDPRVGVAGVRDADPGRVVEVALAVGRDQPRALAAVDVEVRDPAPDRRHDAVVGQGTAPPGRRRGRRRDRPSRSSPPPGRDDVRGQDEQDRAEEHDRADDVDLDRQRVLLDAVDPDRERVRRRARDEVRDDEVVDREREGEQRRRDDPGQDQRERHLPEGRAISFAPRSIAASSRRRSKPASRALTVTTTKLMLNMMWAIRIVWIPSG